MLKQMLKLAFVITFSLNVNAQIQWSKYESNPVLLPGGVGQSASLWYNSVLRIDGTYRMWYQGTSSSNGSEAQIFYATSEDGIIWEKYPDPVLSFGDSGSFDVRAVQTPYVIFHNNIFKMWYAGIPESGGLRFQIGYAESVDGIEWQKHGTDPVIAYGDSGDFDFVRLRRPAVIVEDSLFKMWYSGTSADGAVAIGYAISSDGIIWTKYLGNPVIEPGELGTFDHTGLAPGDIILHNGKFHLWYIAANSIGYAHSSDGISWTKYENNPVLAPDQPWESARLLIGSVHYSQNEGFTMWYAGGPIDVGAAIGIAFSEPFEQENVLYVEEKRWVAGDSVSIPLNLSNSDSVAGIDFKLTYDPNSLEFVGLESTDVTSLFLIEFNDTSPGTLVVSMASTTAIPPSIESSISLLNYVISTSLVIGDTAEIKFLSAGLFDLNGVELPVAFVNGALITTEVGDVNLDGDISSGDAVLTLRYAIGELQPNDDQFIMADRDSNGTIEEIDAACILKLAVGLPCEWAPGQNGISVVLQQNLFPGNTPEQTIINYSIDGSGVASGRIVIELPENAVIEDIELKDYLPQVIALHRTSNGMAIISFAAASGAVSEEGEIFNVIMKNDPNVDLDDLILRDVKLFDEFGGTFNISVITHVTEKENYLAKAFSLSQNHPNPFNPLTNIEYYLPRSGEVSLVIYNLLGEEVARLVDGEMPAGSHTAVWNASNVSSGIYFYRLRAGPPAGGFVQTRKMVFLK